MCKKRTLVYEEQEDMKDIKKILKESTIPFDKVLEKLDIKNEVL